MCGQGRPRARPPASARRACRDNGPLEVEIWWTEAPGLVVSVRSTELFELDELTTIIEQMTPVDAAGYNTFIGAPSNS